MRIALVLTLAGCWTGTTAPPPPAAGAPGPAPLRLRVKLERTACFGTCPIYSVTVHGDGRVEYRGVDHVAVAGAMQGHVSRGELERLSRLIDHAQFFDRNAAGELETGPVCSTVNGMTTCSYSAHFCTDTSHAKLTVTKSGRTHTIDNDHCDPKPGIDELEEEVDRFVAPWVGTR